jgi:hypothetical protein
MEQYTLFNHNDPNVSEILESNTEFEAALEALEKLGWGIGKKDVPNFDLDDSDEDENLEDFLANDYDNDQGIIGKYGD